MTSHQFEADLQRNSIEDTPCNLSYIGPQRLSFDEPWRQSMDDQVIPVLQRTVREVLDEAYALAVKMLEAREMCEHVLQRLEEIAAEGSHVTPPPPLTAINRYTTILTRYSEFLERFSSKKAVFRLIQNRVVVRENLRFHSDIDNLLNGLRLPSGSRVLEDWRPQWETFRAVQYVAFKAMSRSEEQLLHNVRPQDTHTQSQALGLIMFEYNRVNSVYTDRELKLLHNAFSTVYRFSGNMAQTNATWFLPPYEVQVNDTPFAWGSYGTVHYAKLGGSDVAVKRMRILGETCRASFVASFVKEANIWFSANKIPNVVRLYGAYYDDEEPYFVSEYAANGTLRSYLFKEEGRSQTWKLLREVANGIMALHKMGILHNDLKCDNILVGADGVAKITDFGLCCKVSSLPSACEQRFSEQQSAGAIPWKAFEILATTGCPSFKSDIYSFGMCIVEAVTREFPWHKAAPAMIRHKVKNGKLPPRPERGFDDDQWALVTQMCARDPNDRPPMEKVVEKLHEFETREANKRRSLRRSSLLPPEDVHAPAPSKVGSQRSRSPRLSSAGSEFFSLKLSTAAGHMVYHDDCLMQSQTQTSSSGSHQLPGRGDAFAPASPGDVGIAYNSDAEIDQERKPERLYVASATVNDYRYVNSEGTRKQIVQYQVAIQLTDGTKITVWKRFSAFRNFHRGTRQDCNLAPFPSRFALLGNKSRSTVVCRQQMLGAYLESVVASTNVPFGVLVSARASYFKRRVPSKVLL